MEAEGAEAALERHDVCQCCVGPILSGRAGWSSLLSATETLRKL